MPEVPVISNLESEAPAEKVFTADQTLAVDLEATPVEVPLPQLILTKALEAVLEMLKDVPSKDMEVMWTNVPAMAAKPRPLSPKKV